MVFRSATHLERDDGVLCGEISERKEKEGKNDIQGENDVKIDKEIEMTRYSLGSSARKQLSW